MKRRRSQRRSPKSNGRLLVKAKRPVLPKGPFWDERIHTFYWDGKFVKHYSNDAKYQETVLTAFQRSGWPPCLSVEELKRCRPDLQDQWSKSRLWWTIDNLNRSL
jgi:hypothetical protein